MTTIALTATYTIEEAPAEAAAAFQRLWKILLTDPSVRYWSNGAFELEAPGRFRSQSDLRPFGHMETVVTFQKSGRGSIVTYERIWDTGKLRPPIPAGLYRRAWRSLFRGWQDGLVRCLEPPGLDGPAAA